jgi:pyruvate/2-oxoglutarate dehydrogenase complex dihydrolipoamide acyltransferase (E2) component
MKNYTVLEFPKSRLATIDVYAAGKQKHHICGLLECDVTESRLKLKDLKSKGNRISFTAWLLKVISITLSEHKEAAAFIYGKKKIIIFDDISISTLVEKKTGEKRVPMPLVIKRVNQKSLIEITKEIEQARNESLSENTVVLNKKTSMSERLYYHLPGFLRRMVWRVMLNYPRFLYEKMGNAAVTSVGMFGKINGWFIHSTIHPVSFGVGAVIKKPAVVNDEIVIREILNMTVLIDHDVIDGAPMVRFVNSLIRKIEKGEGM